MWRARRAGRNIQLASEYGNQVFALTSPVDATPPLKDAEVGPLTAALGI